MDRGDRVSVAIWRIDQKTGMESLCLGDVSSVSQCDVCLHVAFLRECRVAGMASDRTSGHNGAGELYAVCGGVVAVARTTRYQRLTLDSQGFNRFDRLS